MVGWGKYYYNFVQIASSCNHAGLPIPIIAISTAVSHEQYGINDRWYCLICIYTYMNKAVSYRCWISEENGAIWAFIAPMLLIILV